MSNAPETSPVDSAAGEAAQGQADQAQPGLERGTYEIIQSRLQNHAAELRKRLEQLNDERREVFGSIETKLVSTKRITTANNCLAQDIIPVGDSFLFGYNVQMGLKSVTEVADVFTVYKFEEGEFQQGSLDLFVSEQFKTDFAALYKYYKDTRFLKFYVAGPNLYFVFQVGKTVSDFKTFKFLVDGNSLRYLDNRSDHEVQAPPQHDFQWHRTTREQHRSGDHPHISIDDRVFVETVHGDLTVKVEDNTETGYGIYAEPVADPDQTLDDAEIHYAIVGNIILMKIRPFREDDFRYVVFNEKTQSARRLDAIAGSCILLPEDHGLIFSNGYYLQTGVYKTFESGITDLQFERRIASPNGEDYLYVFHCRNTGQYVLLSYNMIEQKVETPIVCNGFAIFETGQLIYFKSDESPQKHHGIQIWQTPYVGQDVQVDGGKADSYIFKIGNKEIVRAMSEVNEVLNLIDQEDSYANLYVDLVRKSTDVIDSYFWLADEHTFNIAEPMGGVREAATAAVDEFDKVVRVRSNTKKQFDETSKTAREAITTASTKMFRQIDDFVAALSALRMVRGQVISLKELKYIDLAAVEELENQIAENTERLSQRCVEFLLKEDSLQPYADKVSRQRESIDQLKTGVQAKGLDEEIAQGASDLEMLIEIVSNLKIDDATQRTAIIDNISAIYSNLNQTRAALKKKSQELMSVEGAAEFNSQIKLLSQAVVNYLDVCDSPEKCDEYLTRMMVQIEELEGRFAGFDEFIVQLAEKREEVYAAFDTRKLQLVEARNRRATALMAAADRILKGIRSRLSNFDTVDEINSYFASDLMIDKVRDIVDQLKELDESVKVDDVQSRMKTIREDTVRQLRDRNELYVDGQNIIQLGEHKFSVNVQPLDLTAVIKEGEMYFHLSGTNFFEKVDNERLAATRDVWDQTVISENKEVYRSEYLAYLMLQAATGGTLPSPAEISAMAEGSLLDVVQQFMAPRYSEGYVKGVHDHDAELILAQLVKLELGLELLKYSSPARALGGFFWYWLGVQGMSPFQADLQITSVSRRAAWEAKLASLGAAGKLFGKVADREKYVVQIASEIKEMITGTGVGDPRLASQAAGYVFDQFTRRTPPVSGETAHKLCLEFKKYLKHNSGQRPFDESTGDPSLGPIDRFVVIRDWLASFIEQQERPEWLRVLDEAATMMTDGTGSSRQVVSVSPTRVIEGLLGDHPRVDAKTYELDYNDFITRLTFFQQETAPAFESYLRLKKKLTDQRRYELRLEEFKPRVLTSFVRNKLINDTYLPMVGANLAKQIGVVGEEKRTDLMGLLLLVSPPGYGKTTLMEYMANRLGITFMKINGPAIGHQVTSLDPAEAPNASAREEIEKLNLALEMGDNVMIYVDDIQHCNPEFLQKFISLCDATRRIEGVFNGRTRTYDLRGRKVAVVMAGNPYTESGEKFQIPDMLASRADTYNLGDVIGDNLGSFELSYLENCLTSNPTLARLNSRSRDDIYAIIKMARHGNQGETLEGNYSIEEVNEFIGVMQKLLVARDVILRVNREYIESAAQSDDYRTEPAFKLQGSYRDMNKIAEQIAPIMNDEELNTLIRSHYLNQAQTLTTGAEANLLKLWELMGQMTAEERQRWDSIKNTFKRNLLLGSASKDDQFSQVIAQLTTFSDGLNQIRGVLDMGVGKIVDAQTEEANVLQTATMREISHAVGELATFNKTLDEIKDLISDGAIAGDDTAGSSTQKVQVINKVPDVFLEVMRNQFRVLQTWMEPILNLAESMPEASQLGSAARATGDSYEEMIGKIEQLEKSFKEQRDASDADGKKTPAKKAKKKTTRKRKSSKKTDS
ncbi:MAG: DNA repair ATPase [Planctomycetota bacterium]